MHRVPFQFFFVVAVLCGLFIVEHLSLNLSLGIPFLERRFPVEKKIVFHLRLHLIEEARKKYTLTDIHHRCISTLSISAVY